MFFQPTCKSTTKTAKPSHSPPQELPGSGELKDSIGHIRSLAPSFFFPTDQFRLLFSLLN